MPDSTYPSGMGRNGGAAVDTARRVTILGSSGSIGCATLELIRFARSRDPEAFPIEAIVANRNVDRLIEQAREFRPAIAVVGSDALLEPLREGLAGTGIEAAAGRAAVVEAARRPADWLMAAIVGAAGLEPTLAALETGCAVALANKECLVCAGALFMTCAREHGARVLPVDSEHNAIFQVLEEARMERVEKLILTASGGPFRTWGREAMAEATPKQAVAHPNWSMGAKISVDSATMMNKGLEVIEASYLFDVEPARLDVIVHPQSVIHSMVAYDDGSVLAQLGAPDMKTPIASTLAWPARMTAPSDRLDLSKVASLTFEAPDDDRFPALRLAREALEARGAAPTILNAANEVAVAAFLAERIGFLDIARVVGETIEAVAAGAPAPCRMDDVFAVDRDARRVAEDLAARLER